MGLESVLALPIAEGKRLIDRFRENGIKVTAAAWIKECDRAYWYLYIASSLVRKNGSTKAGYGRVNELIRELQEEGVWMDYFMDVMLIGSADPVAKALMAVPRRKAAFGLTWFLGPKLGDMAVEQTGIYEL